MSDQEPQPPQMRLAIAGREIKHPFRDQGLRAQPGVEY